MHVSMPSRAVTSFLRCTIPGRGSTCYQVSMPSRAVTSFLPSCRKRRKPPSYIRCQCPHGLLPHFYYNMGRNLIARLGEECQCPHGLLPHFYKVSRRTLCVLRVVSMPSRAVTSFLQYPFKNLGFMRFPEPVFAGICQNILTVAHFHAC